MAYNSAHTGPEIDAAVQLLGQIQDARDSTRHDLVEVRELAAEVKSDARQVSEQASAVDTKSAQVIDSAEDVERARIEVESATISALESRDAAAASATSAMESQAAASASELSAAQSQLAAGLSEQVSAEHAAESTAAAEQVAQDRQAAQASAESAAISAQNAEAVVTGGTASVIPAAGKLPLADALGQIDEGWIPPSIARTDAVQSAAAAAAEAVELAAEAQARTSKFLDPSPEEPATRDDGSPLQIGDKYTNTVDQSEYIYRASGWASNESLLAVNELQAALHSDSGADEIGHDGETVGQALNKAKVLSGYAGLRQYQGSAEVIHLTQTGIKGYFQKAADPSPVDNDGTRIIDASGRAWDRIIGDHVDPSWFGAVSGSASNASAAFVAASAVAKLLGLPVRFSGTYRLTQPVDFREVALDARQATFFLDSSNQIGLILGGNASQSWNPPQEIGRVFRVDGNIVTPSVRIMGAKGQRIYIGRSHFVQLYASSSAPDRARNYSIAYNTFVFAHVDQITLDTDPANAEGPSNSEAGSRIQWINENQFYLNRCHGLRVTGSYGHNHNKFFAGTFEGPTTIAFDVGSNNQVLGLRLEQGPTTITFGATTGNNWIQKSWDGVLDDRVSGLINGTVTDLGVANVVSDDFNWRHNTVAVAFASISDEVVNNVVGDLAARIPHLQRVGGVIGNAPICMSDKIPLTRDLQFYWAYMGADLGDTVLYRPLLEFFDKNMLPINAMATWILSNGITTVSGNSLSTGTGGSQAFATVTKAAIDAGAAFVRAGIRLSASQTQYSLARTLAIYASLPPNVLFQGALEPKRRSMTVVSAAPTQGFVPVGHTCILSSGATLFICTFAFETTTTSAVASGGASIPLASAAGVAVGDRVGINMNNRDTHWPTVSSVSGNAIGISVPLPSGCLSGARVVFNRQVTK